MTKSNLTTGMMVVTANGVARIVMPTKTSGLILVSQDNKALRVDKMNEDLTRGRYKVGNDVVKVYDIMDDVNGELFSEVGRTLLFDRAAGDCDECDCGGVCCGCSCDDDDEEEILAETAAPANADVATTFGKDDITAGMLAVTRDGKNRLAIPVAGETGQRMVLADKDSKFVYVDKLGDDLSINGGAYRKDGKTVEEVYDVAAGVTTDFYSTDNRKLLFKRDAE